MIDDCYKIIQNFENFAIVDSTICIGNYKFKLNITDFDVHVADKALIAKNYLFQEIKSEKKTEFPPSLINFCEDYEKDMVTAFFASETPKLNVFSINSNSSFINETGSKLRKQFAIDQKLLRKELEWQKQEVKILKGQLKAKIQEIKNKENWIQAEFLKIKKHTVILAKESSKIEKQWEDLNEKKEKQLKISEFLQKSVSGLLAKTETSGNSLLSNNNFDSFDQGYSNEESNLNVLNQELKDCENQYRTSSVKDSESILLKINHLKNQINSIKSREIIMRSMEKSKNLKGVMSKMQKVYSIKNILPHPNLTPGQRLKGFQTPLAQAFNNEKKNITISTSFEVPIGHSRSSTYTPLNFLNRDLQSRCFIATPTTEIAELNMRSDGFYNYENHKFMETELNDEKNEKYKLLVIKEARLQEKEEELIKKEKWLRNNLEKTFNDQEYLNLLKNEKMTLNRVKKELETKEKLVEKKLVEAEGIKNSMMKKNQEIETKKSDLESSKINLEIEKEDLVQKIEEIQKFIRENI